MKINELLSNGYNTLKEANVESYMIDCNLLLCHVLNVDKVYIILNKEKEIEEDKTTQFLKLIKLRAEKMPIKYITRNTEFMGLDFKVEQGVLIPRPDTEVLVEECIKIITKNNFKDICDVCCGSGAIGLSVAYYIKNATVKLYDISDTALKVTEENIKNLDLDKRCFREHSDLLKKAKEDNLKFDMIISNPPYIRKEVIPTLMEDVKNYEPHLALDGGDDGLDFYKRITKESYKILNCGGYLAFEIGHDQKDDVTKILGENKFENIYSLKDLYNNDRVVIGQKQL